ncbi:MAG TPA: hypothetical protein VHC19_19935 [Pirellulales bacterium]|nr:hypothetical protein [Pirellulales bacterium]
MATTSWSEEKQATMELQGLDAVDPAMREPIRRYAEHVRKHAGEKALSLTLFGAIASGTFDAGKQAAANVLVLDAVDLEVLKRLAAEGHKFGNLGIAAPLVMTPDFIRASLDTFPLELLEIQQRRLVLFGEDMFAALQFHREHVRLQCERELKTLMMGIRQGLIASAGKDKSLGAIAAQAAGGLARILRGLLWLHDVKEPKPAAELAPEISKIVGRPLPGIRGALSAPELVGWGELQKLYEDVEALGQFADAR